jgi:hypothetical protein
MGRTKTLQSVIIFHFLERDCTAQLTEQLHLTKQFKQRRLSAEAKTTLNLLRVPPDQPAIESRDMTRLLSEELGTEFHEGQKV